MKRTLYQTLEVESDATQAEIKKAYKKLAKKHHPDKGGDPQIFAEINNAHRILTSPEHRKRYDETGMEGDKFSFTDRFRDLANKVLMAAATNHDPDQVDLIEFFKLAVKKSLETCADGLVQTNNRIDKYKKVKKNLKYKGTSEKIKKDPINDLVENQIALFEQSLAGQKEEIEFYKDVYDLLGHYEYNVNGTMNRLSSRASSSSNSFLSQLGYP